jgi:hypothetical protein
LKNEQLAGGVDFITTSDNLDFITAAGKLHFQIISAFTEIDTPPNNSWGIFLYQNTPNLPCISDIKKPSVY